MSYQERRAIVNIISSVLITAFYSAYMVERYPQVDSYAPDIFHFWGSYIMLLIPVSIVARIIIYIIFSIINTIATREQQPDIEDERDKLIELKASQNSGYVFIIGFVLAMGSLVISQPPAVMFIILIGFGLASDVLSNLFQFIYYRRGF